jgi:hypothetical protein
MVLKCAHGIDLEGRKKPRQALPSWQDGAALLRVCQ